jgi:hypothetical protein
MQMVEMNFRAKLVTFGEGTHEEMTATLPEMPKDQNGPELANRFGSTAIDKSVLAEPRRIRDRMGRGDFPFCQLATRAREDEGPSNGDPHRNCIEALVFLTGLTGRCRCAKKRDKTISAQRCSSSHSSMYSFSCPL